MNAEQHDPAEYIAAAKLHTAIATTREALAAAAGAPHEIAADTSLGYGNVERRVAFGVSSAITAQFFNVVEEIAKDLGRLTGRIEALEKALASLSGQAEAPKEAKAPAKASAAGKSTPAASDSDPGDER